MEFYYNIPKDNSHISNLAFIRALFIRDTIEKFNISFEEKNELKEQILEYLKKGWNSAFTELKSHKKRRICIWKRK